jgi:hypothetical protein
MESRWHEVEQVMGELLELSTNEYQQYLDESGLKSTESKSSESKSAQSKSSESKTETKPAGSTTKSD